MIKDTDTPAEIREKLMLLGASAITAIGLIAIGEANLAPLGGFVAFFSLLIYFIRRAQCARRAKAQAAALMKTNGEV